MAMTILILLVLLGLCVAVFTDIMISESKKPKDVVTNESNDTLREYRIIEQPNEKTTIEITEDELKRWKAETEVKIMKLDDNAPESAYLSGKADAINDMLKHF